MFLKLFPNHPRRRYHLKRQLYIIYIYIIWPHACCICVYKIYDHMHVAFPRIIPRIIPANHTTNHTHGFEAMHVLKHVGYYYGIGKSWWSLFCGYKLGVYVYLLACRPCLSRYGRSQGCQTMSPEWPSTQDVHLFCFVFDIKLCPSTLFLQKQSPARVIPRIIPDTYHESYPNLALLCHGPVGPFRKQPQSPAWCRREPFDIGYI